MLTDGLGNLLLRIYLIAASRHQGPVVLSLYSL